MPDKDLLVGRAAERAVIDRLLADAEQGGSGAVLLVGPAGIGKSTLLNYAARTGTSFRVCRTAGIESEVMLAYAGAARVVIALADCIGSLADRQRGALEAAIGRAHQDDLDPFAVGLGLLNLLDEAARAQPVLVVVDEAQWLDHESARAFSFVGHRLHAEGVALLVAWRDTPEKTLGFEGFRRVDVGGLCLSDAVDLLTSVASGPIDTAVAERIAGTTGGNPLALIELPSALTADQLGGAAPLPNPLPIGERLAAIFAARAQALDGDAQRALLLASAEQLGDPALLQRAATALGDISWEQATAKAEASGLVTFTPTVEFRHPLVRSAVYYRADPAQRRLAHSALAEALEDEGDADRRAWHLGAAAVAPDESAALDLEASAERARRRGGSSVAATYLQRAAELTSDADRATGRLLEAARAALTAGHAQRAEDMVDRARATAVGRRYDADAGWTEALIRLVTGDVREAARLLGATLPAIDGRDREVAFGASVAAQAVAIAGSHLVDEATRAAVARGTRRLSTESDMPAAVADLVRGLAGRIAGGDSQAIGRLGAAVSTVTLKPSAVEQHVGRHVHVVYFDAVLAAADVLDDRALDELTHGWVRLARRTDALAALPLALSYRSWVDVLQGRFGSAASHLAEIDALVPLAPRGLLGSPRPALVLRDAWHGHEDPTRTGARRMMQDGHDRGHGSAIDHAYAALVVLELGGGRYDSAFRAARRICDHDSIGLSTPALADLVEAAVRGGEREVAEQTLDRLGERANASGSPWARGLLARAGALLATDADAGDLFESALDHFSGGTIATDRARTHLLYGEWLRRVRRRREAREPLHDALEFFEAIGARDFAARARRELAATGEHLRTRTVPTDALTPQEAQIARLAAAGDRNQDIAAQLFITTSTVEYHLRKVFLKLGVRSRTQLAQVDLPA